MQSENEDENSCALEVKICFEELVKFTLQSFVDEAQEFQQLPVPRDFCSTLLKDDPDDAFSDNIESLEGVPPYPLYKRLASALMKCISSEAFCITDDNLIIAHENDSMRQKQNEWLKLILDKGSEILDILKSVSFELHVQEPFFSQLKDGLKTIEGRCAVGKYSRIELGNLILINKSVVFEVQGVRWYPTFLDLLEAEGLGKVLPGVENIAEGVGVYRRFYTEEKEKANGVLAINVSKLGYQPYNSLATLFAGLSYEGVQGFLGLKHTTGTIPDALPPPRSVLLASFNLPYKTDVKHSALTHGARALAKHTHRCSNRYWGSLDGNDSNKNRLAMDVIDRLIAHCCWLNVHIVPPHGGIFEIRVAEGYGARWTQDGSEFIGFLEPYTQEGYSMGWRH